MAAARKQATQDCKVCSSNKPVDLVHLATQTMGDRELENEVLAMFLSQSANYLNEFLAASDWEARKKAAHKIKGTARGLGAWDLANAAELAEAPEYADSQSLEQEFSRVSAYIRELQH